MFRYIGTFIPFSFLHSAI